MKAQIFFLICVVSIQQVFCLDCYATDLLGLATGNIQSNLQNCDENIKQLMQMQGQSAPSSHDVASIDFRCYKVVAASGDATVAIKGCIPNGGCKTMKHVFGALLKQGDSPVKDVDCYECSGHRCNAATKNTVFGFVILGMIAFAVLL